MSLTNSPYTNVNLLRVCYTVVGFFSIWRMCGVDGRITEFKSKHKVSILSFDGFEDFIYRIYFSNYANVIGGFVEFL